ncbi:MULTISPECIES: DUF4297 family anti-phage-associated protein [Vibrio]|uniref:DUF4297 family anti-phage-associated protein n=1 Tax=Vibrio TaxID=662 RepID=UPI0002FBBEE4|nr:DUF4297 family anti-phage-associated protein [Vibrio tasmaniensis]OEF72081.1 hypothetical protein A162_20480 [Vibrio tasmaniensis 1F-155]PMO78916.1 hypothetical protein BCT01_11200 [Vibrio tasmaniensis]
MDRSAINTIRGYCYQFDKSILELMKLSEGSDSIEVEGIEDVDVKVNDETTAVQCKYYENTDYVPSVIAKPIRLMLEHFKSNPTSINKYHIYGHYKSGHEKLVLPITLTYLKEKFLTYKKDKIEIREYERLGIDDSDLNKFLLKLSIDINATSFDKQQEEVITCLSKYFDCDRDIANHYYNNAFTVVKELGCNHISRQITKQNFVNEIDNSKVLYNSWRELAIGREQYIKELNRTYFKRSLSTEAYSRVFSIDCKYSDNKSIKDCIYEIQRKWSQLSTKAVKPFSPYIYLNNIDEDKKINLKNELYDQGLLFSDGYNFLGALFCHDSIINSESDTKVKFQMFDNISDIDQFMLNIKNRVEIYEFTYSSSISLIKHPITASIQIKGFEDIKGIV